MRSVYQFLFKLFGWKVRGHFPVDVKKYIIAVAPHTSNWDFLVGIAARSVLHIEHARYLGKDSLFKPPLGWFFRITGGIPVDRSKSHDVTDQIAGVFQAHEDFVLAVAPEGTRKKVQKLKTGFYYIATKANVPIIPVGFDYLRKEVIIGAPLHPSDFEKDMARLLAFYATISGKNPEYGLG